MTTLEMMIDELLAAHRFHDAQMLLDDAGRLTPEEARAIALHPKRINYLKPSHPREP